jgi:hypothetical protein
MSNVLIATVAASIAQITWRVFGQARIPNVAPGAAAMERERAINAIALDGLVCSAIIKIIQAHGALKIPLPIVANAVGGGEWIIIAAMVGVTYHAVLAMAVAR